ncbi:MAG: hypothetical protein ACKN9T_01595 [Candidatus Methylumidiphilus sp.]
MQRQRSFKTGREADCGLVKRFPPPEEARKSRVFGVVLDTSGSMDLRLLGKALGAIAS